MKAIKDVEGGYVPSTQEMAIKRDVEEGRCELSTNPPSLLLSLLKTQINLRKTFREKNRGVPAAAGQNRGAK